MFLSSVWISAECSIELSLLCDGNQAEIPQHQIPEEILPIILIVLCVTWENVVFLLILLSDLFVILVLKMTCFLSDSLVLEAVVD